MTDCCAKVNPLFAAFCCEYFYARNPQNSAVGTILTVSLFVCLAAVILAAARVCIVADLAAHILPVLLLAVIAGRETRTNRQR